MKNSVALDGNTQVEFTTSAMLETWKCGACNPISEVVILNVMRGEDDCGQETSGCSPWGNPDYKPFCPHCGSKEKMSR